MKNKISEALNEVRDAYIAESARPKKKLRWLWIPSVAAVVAIVIFVTSLIGPMQLNAMAISKADYDLYAKPDYEASRALSGQLDPFLTATMTQILGKADGENKAYSPVNLYLAMTLLAELSEGDLQLMEALGATDIQTLRDRGNTLWNTCYREKNNKTTLANSIWLQKGVDYDRDILDTLAKTYFTSSYEAEFGTEKTNDAISQWVKQQTGNILKNTDTQLDSSTLFALYSTVYYQAKWREEFSSKNNTKGIFHGPEDTQCTFMNKQKMEGVYYWGDDYGAVPLHLKDGSQMWLILPDEGKTPEDIIASGAYLEAVLCRTSSEDRSKEMFINLTLPKFDISSRSDLRQDLEALDITNVFDPEAGAFDTFLKGESPVWIQAVNQSTRVCIDEEGVTAASYIEIPGAGAAQPPEDTIDFILDRPFVFVITNNYNLPLFAGVVNAP